MNVLKTETTPPVEPQLESVTVQLDVDDLLYIVAELGGGNSYYHPGAPDVYSKLFDVIDRDGLTPRLRKQEKIAQAFRSRGSGVEAKALYDQYFG